jgi:hypothetical protein
MIKKYIDTMSWILTKKSIDNNLRVKFIALGIALFSTAVFFYPSLYGQGTQAGFVFFGDPWHAIVAQLHIAGFYSSHGVFSGIDFFTNGGASEYFLRPNFPVYHPLVILLSPFFQYSSPESYAILYVAILTIHAFIGMYFTQRLCCVYFKFNVALSAFVSICYVFSVLALMSMTYLPYSIITWMIPVAIYANLSVINKRTITQFILASVPSFIIFLSGYVPLSVVAVVMSAALAVFICYEIVQERVASDINYNSLMLTIIPTVISTFFVLPLYIAINRYHHTVSIWYDKENAKLGPIAFSLSEYPTYLFRLFADNFNYLGPRHEFSLFWGLIPVFIFIVYIVQYRPLKANDGITSFHHKLMKTSLVIYTFSALIIFGKNSVLSEVVYYFIPIAGKVHIYQRYLIFSQLFLAIFLGIMLSEIAEKPQRKIIKFLCLIVTVSLIVVGHTIGNYSSSLIDIKAGLVIEVVYLLIFLLTLILCRPKTIICVATILIFLVSLGAMYRYSNDPAIHLSKIRSQQITYDPEAMAGLVNFFKGNSNKEIIKIINLLPSPQPYIPKNFPWFVVNSIKLSCYFGYDWHLSTDDMFRRTMEATLAKDDPDLVFRPDWKWLGRTGAQFVLLEENRKSNDPLLSQYIDLTDPQKIYRMHGGGKDYIAAPLKFPELQSKNIVFDNGYIRIRSEDVNVKIELFSTNYAGDIRFNIESSKPVTVEYLFWPNKNLHAKSDNINVPFSMTDGLYSINLLPGNHSVCFYYRSVLLNVFCFFYFSYVLMVLLGIANEISNYRLRKFIIHSIPRRSRKIGQSVNLESSNDG